MPPDSPEVPDNLKTDYSVGVIPIHVEGGVRRYLLVKHKAGHWGFPKGHPDKGESPRKTALRELAEETGIEAVELIDANPITESYVFTKKRSGKKVHKRVEYFLGLVADPAVRPQPEEVVALAWGNAEATAARLTFERSRVVLAEAERLLRNG